MTPAKRILRIIGLALKLFIIALVLLFVMALIGISAFELIAHLVGGFVFFLIENVPKVSADHATWLPGIAAFLLATGLAHWMLRKIAITRDREWSFKTTVCLALNLPVLFVISFIVPGVILQADSLARIRWFESSSGSTRAMVTMELRNLAILCQLHAQDGETGKYPDSLDELTADFHSEGRIHFPSHSELPAEPPIYLGAGFPIDTNSDEALLISPAFKIRGEWKRVVQKFNGSVELIPALDAESWMDRCLENRR